MRKVSVPAIAFGALLSSGGFFLWSMAIHHRGYPLDDAWIYQTYARNLAQFGEWAFVPGTPSGGSTGPLWVLLLSAGYRARADHFIWSYLLGYASLFAIGLTGIRGVQSLRPKLKKLALAAGAVLVFEWHLVWAAVSGMETALAALLTTGVLVYLLQQRISPRAWLLLGTVIGISVWVRPDGLLLLGPAVFALLLETRKPRKTRFRDGALMAAGFAVPFGLYLLFNQAIAGTVWPNTFYAKQAEYAELQSIPLPARYAQQLIQPLTGVGIVLLPGFIFALISAIRQQQWKQLAAFLWMLGYLGTFAIRLPVTYQHGRYAMPAMPIFFILGLAGTLEWVQKYRGAAAVLYRVLAKTWLVLSLLVTGMFWFLGAKAFTSDVTFIEDEMVSTARWVAAHTEPDSRIAAHDIGALGYFGEREIIDLAGLVSPDVIPFMRDEAQLADYLDSRNADYLVTFPDWYPELVTHAALVYQTDSERTRQAGYKNMAVYRWR